MFSGRIISFFAPLAIFTALALVFRLPAFFYYLLLAALALSGLSLWYLTKNIQSLTNRLIYLFYGWLIIISTQAFLAMLENIWLSWGVWFLGLALTMVYFNNLFKRFFVQHLRGAGFSAALRVVGAAPTETFLNLNEAVIVFFSAASLFALRDLANYHHWLLLPIFGMIIFFLNWGNLRLGSGSLKGEEKYYALLAAVIATELFWALAALSLAFYLKGFVFSFIYLLFWGYRLSIVEPSFNRKYFRPYLIVALIIIFIILITAKWF